MENPQNKPDRNHEPECMFLKTHVEEGFLQRLHKVLPSTTSYYQACTRHFPVLLFTEMLACKVLANTTLYYKACTRHYTLPTSHLTLHTLHFTLHTPHCTLSTPHSTLHTPHFTLQTSQCTFIRHNTLPFLTLSP